MEHELQSTNKSANDTRSYQSLGSFIKQNPTSKRPNLSGAAIGANTLSKANGIMTEEGIRQISGWTKSFKGSAMKEAMKDLNRFHEVMNNEVSVADVGILDEIKDIFDELVADVTWFIRDGSRIYKKEAAALRPVMSSLLIQLYSMGNVFDHRENIAYDYLMENDLASARVGDIITGHGAMSVQGNMVSTGIESGQIDRTAQQMNEWNGKPKTDYLQEVKSRRLPSLNDKNATEKLELIAKMLEDIELQAKDEVVEEDARENQRQQVRTQFFDVTKMIHLLLASPGLMTGEGLEKIKTGKISHERTDLLNTAEYFQAVAGMTIGEAVEKLDEIRQAKAETAAMDSIANGGVQSQVLIDTKKNRVLRTTKEQGGIQSQKRRNNFNYDEAMSRLGEITGLGGQAGARTTYYKDLQGNLQYGTNMDKAKGSQARDVKLSFGDAQVDSQMKAGRYNIFGHGTEQELTKNAGLIISSFKMQIIDYLSMHRDRHDENYFIDMDAEDSTQAFVGIDNDNVFGHSPNKIERSYKEHANERLETEVSKLANGYLDLTTVLKGFEYIPKETAKQIADLDEEKINKAMKPYLDRASRFSLLKRIRKLKEYAASEAKVVDVYTKEGMEKFKSGTMGIMVRAFLENKMYSSFLGSHGAQSVARIMPGILLRTLAMQYFGVGTAVKKKNSEEYKYVTEFEYMKEGESVPDYFAKSNKSQREEKFWKSFEGIIRAAGMTEHEEYQKLKRMHDSSDPKERAKLEMFF